MKKELRWYDYITININWFALTTRSQVLTPLVIPLLVQQFVGEANKGSALGTMRLWALMAAVLIQALMGLLSDHNTSRFGRRRPFIFIGVIIELVVLTAIGLTANLEGMSGYWVLFALYIVSMLGSNISHAATQGLIPDMVPAEKKGLASGIKAMLELPLPLIFASFVVAGMIERGNLWGALISLMVVLVVAMSLTMFVKEVPLSKEQPAIDWNPIIRLLLMTGVFTVVILGSGWAVNQILTLLEGASKGQAMLIGGIGGILGMAVAIFIGVILSLRISLADEISDHRSFMWWVVNRLAFLVAANNLAGFMVYFLQERFTQYSGAEAAGPAARIVMFVGIFILLSALPSGWLSDKFGKKLVSAAAGILVGIGAAIVIFAPDIGGVMYAGGAVVGLGVGSFYSANWALGTEIVPEGQAGKFLGLSNLAGAGAGAIGAYIGGPIADNLSYVLLMSIYGSMAVLSTLALLGIHEKRAG
jgi:MFS family permease